jgi:hypothetical protein
MIRRHRRQHKKSFRFVVRIWEDEVDRLDAAALERDMLPASLGVEILRTLLREGLVDAVLDDPSRRERCRRAARARQNSQQLEAGKSLSDGQPSAD